MKALSIAVLAAALGSFAIGQQLPVLGDARPIDVRVDRVDWHPHGDALLYSRAEEGGVGVGVYRLGDVEGKVLVHLGEKDVWESYWLPGLTDALVVVYRNVSTGQGQQKEAAVYLLNGKAKTGTQVFSKIVPSTDQISLDVDISPSLLHAIFTVRIGKDLAHYVLPNNGGKLVASRDIDEAIKAGNFGPSWSQDGTAIYGGIPGNGGVFEVSDAKVATRVALDEKVQAVAAREFAVSLTLAGGKLTSDNGVISFKMIPPAPPVGASVFEVVPSNGVLRPVRFKGPWVEAPGKPPAFQSKSNPSQLAFGQMHGSSTSLWLMTGKTDGLLVAAHANQASIAPLGRAIAYVTDGALFVREINPK
jgi:hypothetical protein